MFYWLYFSAPESSCENGCEVSRNERSYKITQLRPDTVHYFTVESQVTYKGVSRNSLPLTISIQTQPLPSTSKLIKFKTLGPKMDLTSIKVNTLLICILCNL